MKHESIAIIGSGISGLACAHFLHREHDVTVFEKDDHVGGHSHTVMVPEGSREIPVDTGFMVYNEVTYPLLTRLFKDLGVETKQTTMSFSVQQVSDDLEFNGRSLNLLFGQRKNLLSPQFWKMLMQIKRFNEETIKELENPQFPDLTLAQYVEKRSYGADFLRWYLSPMAAAVWSSPPDKISDFPAHTLMRFWHNHGFLGLDTQHPWRTVCGGSKEYVKKLSAPFADKIKQGSGVKMVTADNEVTLNDGSRQKFDRVIFASHGDQSLAMLQNPTVLESEFLSAFHYQDNMAVLHTDVSFMPKTKRCWASWNYRVEDGKHSTIYWMNSLQGESDVENYFVSINPSREIPTDKVKRTLNYEHPLFDLNAVAMQSRVREIHAAGKETGRYFCGAWQRYGFHEDGLWSAVNLCTALLEGDPWS